VKLSTRGLRLTVLSPSQFCRNLRRECLLFLWT